MDNTELLQRNKNDFRFKKDINIVSRTYEDNEYEYMDLRENDLHLRTKKKTDEKINIDIAKSNTICCDKRFLISLIFFILTYIIIAFQIYEMIKTLPEIVGPSNRYFYYFIGSSINFIVNLLLVISFTAPRSSIKYLIVKHLIIFVWQIVLFMLFLLFSNAYIGKIKFQN
ncbi:hypothetical protein EDEG_01057 [Edhazardia aedis USNM 41457]|uniref:Uncharacterized protein n=1 Tax=Edhazardia aedis (strain USNM 41457) TaxID=1003232 RepID=J9DTZ3_EDHAE|nr:hypothetical protein EDEG_01057 [Edhazardia aedis USNM 41457]|eukprot:EJW04767.1 hypothetical protein EDEG_01057 [Edhazardia aedis USNM 41457]